MYVCMDLLYRKYDLNHNIGVSGSSAPFREGLGRPGCTLSSKARGA
jgi:hypothetical protein